MSSAGNLVVPGINPSGSEVTLKYRLFYSQAYLIDEDDGPNHTVAWSSSYFDFNARDDNHAQKLVLEWSKSNTVTLKHGNNTKVVHFYASRLERCPEVIPLPDFPNNGKGIDGKELPDEM